MAESGAVPPERRRNPRTLHPAPRVRDIVVALRGAVEQDGWHGPSVLEAVRGVTGPAALRKPAGASHSVLELIQHITHWEAVGLHLVTGGLAARPDGGDWAEAPTAVAAAVRRLRHTHDALIAAVERVPEGGLDRLVPTGEGPRPLAEVLHGVAAHCAYHAGQIRLLLTLS